MKMINRNESALRELSAEEILCVAGGQEEEPVIVVTGTRMTADEKAAYDAANSGDCYFWEIGATFGIGFGLYGTCEGVGISWNAGFGVYGEAGVAWSPEDAADEVGQDRVVIVADDPSLPTGFEIDPRTGEYDPVKIGAGVGIFVKDGEQPQP